MVISTSSEYYVIHRLWAALLFKVCRPWLTTPTYTAQCVSDKLEWAVIVRSIRAQQNNAIVVKTMPNILH